MVLLICWISIFISRIPGGLLLPVQDDGSLRHGPELLLPREMGGLLPLGRSGRADRAVPGRGGGAGGAGPQGERVMRGEVGKSTRPFFSTNQHGS